MSSQTSFSRDLANDSTLQAFDLGNVGRSHGNGGDAGINYQLGFKRSKEQLLTLSYNYTVNNTQLTAFANVTPRPVNLTGTRIYDTDTDVTAAMLTNPTQIAGIGGETLTVTLELIMEVWVTDSRGGWWAVPTLRQKQGLQVTLVKVVGNIAGDSRLAGHEHLEVTRAHLGRDLVADVNQLSHMRIELRAARIMPQSRYELLACPSLGDLW